MAVSASFSTSNAKEWKKRWEALAKDMDEHVEEAVIQGAVLTGVRTVADTTVTGIQTGRAIGNYELDDRAGTSYDPNRFDSGRGTYERLRKKLASMGRVAQYVIWNAVPYVKFLDEGTRKMPAKAITAKAIAAMDRYMSKVTRKRG